MRRLKKNIYLGLWGAAVAVLAVVRYTVAPVLPPGDEAVPPQRQHTEQEAPAAEGAEQSAEAGHGDAVAWRGRGGNHPIRGVHSYFQCFPDAQDVQIVAARRWGVRPVANREQAEERKQELVYMASSPYYIMDKGMTSSIPYLVPRAAGLLQQIGRNYLDSLSVKGVPLHRVIVTSVLRTEEDVAALLRHNLNASPESCHRFGTTFDIAYSRYNTVHPPGQKRRMVQDDTLKWVLSEVLRDLRNEGRCYVKYETHQGCFHITTR